MLIVAMAQTKGGSGKSTLAQNLAVEAVHDGQRVLLIDFDPAQSAAKWWRRRGGPANPMLECDVRTPMKFMDRVQNMAGFDVVIIDTPGELLKLIQTVIAAAHVIVVPMAPSIKDWEAMDAVEDMIVKAGKRPQSLFVINRYRSSTEASIEAKSALHKRTGAVPLTIAMATDHEKADAKGLAATEINNKIAGEFGVMWEEVKRIGKDRSHEQASNVPAA